jgi:MFS family permease
VGINVVFYYGAVLWQAAGFTEDQSLLTNVIGAVVSIAGGVVTLLTIERIGRKRLLMLGSLGMFVAMGIMAFVFFVNTENTDGDLILNRTFSMIALLGNNLFLFFFNLSWGPVMWVMLGEMFPNQMRGSGLAVSGFAQWTSNFGVTMTFPIIMVGLGLGPAFILYSVFALISFFFVKKWVQETKGIELEDMQG